MNKIKNNSDVSSSTSTNSTNIPQINFGTKEQILVIVTGIVLIGVLTWGGLTIKNNVGFNLGLEWIGYGATLLIFLGYLANFFIRWFVSFFYSNVELKQIGYISTIIFSILMVLLLLLLWISLTPEWKWWGYFISFGFGANIISSAVATIAGAERKQLSFWIGAIIHIIAFAVVGWNFPLKM